MGEDGRPYIAVRRKQEIRKDKKENTEHIGMQIKNRVEELSVGEERRQISNGRNLRQLIPQKEKKKR